MREYEELLEVLSEDLNLRLKPNHDGKLKVKIAEIETWIQVEIERKRGRIALLSDIAAQFSAGAVRRSFLEDALAYNALPAPNRAFVGTSSVTDRIYLFRYIDLDVGSEKFLKQFNEFKEEAGLWVKSTERGEIPEECLNEISSMGHSSGMFGLG